METNLTILRPFFEEPGRKFSIRELSRVLRINHTTVRQYLQKLATNGSAGISENQLKKYGLKDE